MPAHITVVGSLNMDLVARSPRIPAPGETILGRDFRTAPGGKGANQAVAAARMGARVFMVGRVGADAFAELLLANLVENGVDHRHVLADDDAASGVAMIVVDDAGQNSIVVAPGANMRLSAADVSAAEPAIASSSILLLQLEIPLEAVVAAAQIARRHGVTVLLNPAPARPLPPELLSQVDILIPNESETALLTGRQVDTVAAAEAAAAELRALTAGSVILTLGERGALLACSGESTLYPAFEVKPVDSTAAGDAFVGALALALAEGRDLGEAVRWGNAAGALATTRFGAQPSLPDRAEVQALL